MNEATGKYLYCFIRNGSYKEFGGIGMGEEGETVYTVSYRDMAAVVSDSSESYFDLTGKNAMCHQKVIGAVMSAQEVVPVRFGVICKDLRALNKLMKDIYPAIMANLERVRNKMEVGLKVFWTGESFVTEVGEANSEIKDLKDRILEIGPEKGYLLMIELGEKLQQIADEKRQYYIDKIYEGLRKEASAARLNDIVGEKMVFNASFLIDKAGEEQFDEAVNKYYEIYSRQLDFKYTGPWPPYNFVEVNVD
jgi:hypothetical protein